MNKSFIFVAFFLLFAVIAVQAGSLQSSSSGDDDSDYGDDHRSPYSQQSNSNSGDHSDLDDRDDTYYSVPEQPLSRRLLSRLRSLNLTVIEPVKNRVVRTYGPDDVIPGDIITPECRDLWMIYSMVTRQNAQHTICPRGAFAALIVNDTDTTGRGFSDSNGNWCGSFVEFDGGLRDATNPDAHSELNAITRLANRFPGHRFDTAFWNSLTMYTNGESCPMDTADEIWAGMKKQVYSVSIKALIALGNNQIDIRAEQLIATSNTVLQARPQYVIRDVAATSMYKYFAWQNIASNPCPAGCHRNAAATCVDDVAYVTQPLPFM